MIWRFTKGNQVEQKALKFIGYTFFMLSILIGAEAIEKLFLKELPQTTIWGIVIALVSIAIMIFCYLAKRKISANLQSLSLLADAKQALACIAMSCALLISSLIYYWWKVWWIDPTAAILIALLLTKEGIGIIKEK